MHYIQINLEKPEYHYSYARRIMNTRKLSSFTAVSLAGISSAFATSDYGPAVDRMITGCAKYYSSGYGHKFCVVHDMEGYYLTGTSYLRRCDINASCHYTLNGVTDYSGDAAPGEISQLVPEAYYSWHATCWNQYSLGCEHEGFASNPAWFTEAMYQSSALLYRHFCDKFGIAKDRNHIVAHGQKSVAGWPAWASANLGINPYCNTHTDPGPYWDWSHYMGLINGAPALVDNASFVSQTVANGTSFSPGQGFSCTWTMHNNGTTTWAANGGDGYTLNYVSGTQMGAPNATPISGNVGPGGNASIPVSFTAPTTPGSYSVVMQMNSTSFAFFGQQVSVAINVVNPVPVITAQPATSTKSAGQTATFTVGATGATSYQWKKNGVNLANGGSISGATAATLTVANAQLSDAAFYTVVVSNAGGSVTSGQAQLVVAATPVTAGNGAGLRGLYYNNSDFTSLAVSRLDANVNFDWGTGSPDASIGADTFSARWTGQVQPLYSQTYTFYTGTDDGVRLWVNGVLLIDHWADQGYTEWSGAIALTAGQKYDIRMDYYENGGGASAQLRWSSASQLKDLIPQTQLYRPPPVLATIGNKTVAESSLLSVPVGLITWDQVGAVTLMEDFEAFADGSVSDQAMFRKPGHSSTTSGYLDGSVTNYDYTTAGFPGGNSSTRALHVSWSFLPASNPWLRLDTFNSAFDPNPVIDITQSLWFDIYADKALQVGVGVRETNPTGAIASNGGTSGTIEYVGVSGKNGTTPIPTRTLPAGVWATLKFNLPQEPATAFTGNGILESTTGKAVLEDLALVAAGGSGVYNVYLDNFLQVQNASLTYSLDPGAPAGATIDPSTGAFSWTPAPGQGSATYNITVRVTDNGSPSLSGTQTFAVTVNAAPTITSQPVGQTVFPNANVTFSVGATGTGPLSYQWRLNGTDISGATDSSYTRNNVQSSDAGDYSVLVSNTIGSVVSANATLAISVMDSPPAITAQPQNRTVNQNASAAFSVTVLGTVPLSYQWQFNGADIGGATGTSYTRSTAQPGDAGSYWVVVTNSFGSATSDVATLTVIVPPSIATQPQSQAVVQGSSVTFTTAANGTPPLAFQWRKGGTPISGATGTSYTLSNVQATVAGTYTVVATNPAGNATSGNAVLTVYVPPAITAHPGSQTVNAGNNVTFTVTATGNPAPTCQWRRDGVNVSGATATSYTRAAVGAADVGLYSVVVSNIAGKVTSAEAILALNAVIVFSDDFESGNLGSWTPVASSPLALSTAQVHGGTYSAYQDNTGDWMYHNLPNLTGHTKINFWWYDDSASTKSYMEIRSYDGGSYGSGSLAQTLAIGKYNTVTAPGESFDSHKYQFRAQYPTASYGWLNCASDTSGGARATGWHQFSIERLADGTTVNYTVDGVNRQLTGVAPNAGHSSQWTTVLLGGGSGTAAITAYWDDVVVTYYDPPSIATQPASTTVAVGAGASFSVVASGNLMTYQWRFNGENLADGGGISGATTPTLTIASAQGANAGTYTVEVANGAGPVVSAAAVLQVSPAITTQPVSQTNLVGSTVTFSVAATGQTPLSYQWKKDGVNLTDGGHISGAQSGTLTVTGIGPLDEGVYTVGVTNPASGVLSGPALLVVMDPPVITTQPVSRAVGAGATVTFSAGAAGGAPLSYQWVFNGNPISGATGASYTRSNVQAEHSGAYTVTVTNPAGSVSSDPATLLVNTAPSLAAIPSRTVHAGSPVVVTASASDPEAPPQTLNFSLDASPTGASIDPGSGVFNWTASAADVGTPKTVTVRVTDNGTPSQSAVQSFTVTVVSPVVIASAVVANDTITLSWNSIPGQTYRVQYKENLTDADWTDLTDVMADAETASVVGGLVNDTGPIPQRFYRILVVN
jgi:hypothetical protein